MQEWEDIEAFRKRLFLLIRVEYEDVFESTYTKDFWWVYKPIDRVWSIYRDQK